MTSAKHICFHHLPRHPVSRALSVILLLPMLLQGCSYRHVIGPTSPPQDYAEANNLLSGHKVRVELSDGSTFSGAEFVRVGPDSVHFLYGANGRIAIPAERLSSAAYPNRLKGLGLGALIGGGIGAIIGLASGDDDPSSFLAFTAEDEAALLGVFGGGLGGIIGLIHGAPTRVIRDGTR